MNEYLYEQLEQITNEDLFATRYMEKIGDVTD